VYYNEHVNTYTAREFAKLIGVSIKTLQRWDREGRLKPVSRSPGNRRIYSQAQLDQIVNQRKPQEQIVMVYMRVSSQAQKPDLENQKAALEQFCIARGLTVDEWISEIGGGLNFKRQKFLDMVDQIIRGEVKTLVIAHQDRLARFGFDLIRHLCETQGCELLILNTESLSPEQELVQDLLSITDSFSVRLDGLRKYRKAVQKALRDDQSPQNSLESHT
jgi:predicted site-specific integrase-resolvase